MSKCVLICMVNICIPTMGSCDIRNHYLFWSIQRKSITESGNNIINFLFVFLSATYISNIMKMYSEQ
ncbi:MAG TPA: hypothetical protein DCS10_01680 [Oscillibacter sp.]|nr:hypothetical protein [Oscillibacter sp.]